MAKATTGHRTKAVLGTVAMTKTFDTIKDFNKKK